MAKQIPLYRNVSGNNFKPVYEVVAYTTVDDADHDYLMHWRWCLDSKGYVMRRLVRRMLDKSSSCTEK